MPPFGHDPAGKPGRHSPTAEIGAVPRREPGREGDRDIGRDAGRDAGREIVPGVKLGRYRVIGRIARGGMAEVFLARIDDGTGLAAIKRLLPHLAREPGFPEMFLDEARVASLLDHPNIVRVIEAPSGGGDPFLAMEFLHGADAHAMHRVASKNGGRLPLPQALHVVLAVCEALHYAHEMRGRDGTPLGLIHRDVSPQNVMVTFDGGVKLLDFGIAKSAAHETATRTGTLKGKVSYMSPEQCLGDRLDRRSDVFSLGIVLWELALGRKLYRGRTDFDVMRGIVESAVPRPREIDASFDAGLEAVLLRALEKDPARRFPTARDFGAALDEVVRRRGLKLQPLGLARCMASLFSTRVEAWKQAKARGIPLADHLAVALERGAGWADAAGDASDSSDEHERNEPPPKPEQAPQKSAPPTVASVPAARMSARGPSGPPPPPPTALPPVVVASKPVVVAAKPGVPTPEDAAMTREASVLSPRPVVPPPLPRTVPAVGAVATAIPASDNTRRTLARLRATLARFPTQASIRAVRTARRRSRRWVVVAIVAGVLGAAALVFTLMLAMRGDR